MTRRSMFLALLAIPAVLTLCRAAPTVAAAPEVTNVVAAQREAAFIVDITFDLADVDSDTLWVSLLLSLDGGATFPVLCENVSGDVGPGVTPGNGKHIVWHARRDIPGLEIANAVVRVRADDAPYPTIASWFRVIDGGTQVPFAAGDTIGFGTPLTLAWSGATSAASLFSPEGLAERDSIYPFDDGLLGYKWQLLGELGGDCIPALEDCWHPRFYNAATGDSVSYFAPVSQLTFFNEGSDPDNPFRRLLPSGPVNLLVNTVDVLGNEIRPADQAFSFVVNHDPQTIVLNGETDWAHPEDPQVYPYYYRLSDPAQTPVPFQAGDRIPDRSYVVVKALCRDDARDVRFRPEFACGLTGSVMGVRAGLNGGLYSFATDESELDTLPAWGAGVDGWFADTLGFMVGPRTTFTVTMTAVDEHGRRDGTPAELGFDVGYPPCVQCIEPLPKTSSVSAFTPDLACQDPGAVPNGCFADTARYFLSNAGSAPDELEFRQTGFIVIDRTSGLTRLVSDTLGLGAQNFIVEARMYNLRVLLHARDDVRETWAEPLRRTMAWRYQVDYECDPDNEIEDGGGNDDIDQYTWGESTTDDLVIDDSTGLWDMDVTVAAPTLLLTLGAETYWTVLHYTIAQQDTVTTDFIFSRSLLQLGRGSIRAVALDQSQCGAFPVRPTRYHYFREVRPSLLELPTGRTWRDCDLSAIVPGIKGSLDLALSAMESGEGEPVVKHFRLTARTPGGTIDCTTPPPHP